MADLILWNSIATRRRSPGDDFLDNGLAILKAYIREQGFSVEVIDWARSGQWEKMTPRILARISGYLASWLFSRRESSKNRGKTVKRLVGLLFILSQDFMSTVQKWRQKKMIRELAQYICNSGCPVVGIKTWYGETFRSARYFAGYLRKIAPEVLIVAGGPHASTYKEAVLEDGLFDIAVAGEGERALAGILALARQTENKKDLLRALARQASLGQLKNVIYRSNGAVKSSPVEISNVNAKALPVYDNFEGKTLIHVIVESLGCPWGKCNFCTHSRSYPTYSARNPESVVEEIEQMLTRGIGIFRYAGSTTLLDHACQIARLIEEKGIRIFYSMFGRVEALAADPGVYEKLVDSYRQLLRSGFRSIFLGVEAADDDINKLVMNKGITRSDVVHTIAAMREASQTEGLPLDVGISLIYPAPTLGKIPMHRLKEENIELIEETEPDSVLVSPPAPFPGSAWFKRKDYFGFDLGETFLRDILIYDYVLYRPLYLWPDIDLKLEGMSLREIFEECADLRQALEKRGFVTEITDVQFLMLRNAGYTGKEGVLEFKNRTQHAILSCDYRWINRLQEQVNQASFALASSNKG